LNDPFQVEVIDVICSETKQAQQLHSQVCLEASQADSAQYLPIFRRQFSRRLINRQKELGTTQEMQNSCKGKER